MRSPSTGKNDTLGGSAIAIDDGGDVSTYSVVGRSGIIDRGRPAEYRHAHDKGGAASALVVSFKA